MEFDPQAPASPESTQGDREKRTKRKQRGRFAAPIPVETDTEKAPAEAAKEAKQPEHSILDEALTHLTLKTREGERASKGGTQATPEAVASEAAAEPLLEAADPDENDPAGEDKAYEPLLIHELKPTEFSGGEVIIELQGDRPVVERVVAASDGELPLEAGQPEVPALSVFAAQSEHAMPLEAEPDSTAVLTGEGEVPPVELPERPSFGEVSPEPSRPVAEILPPEALTPSERPAVKADMYPYAPASEQSATRQDVKEAISRAEKAGQNRGVLAGALFFGGLEHFRHRRHEKRLEKHLRKQSEQFSRDREDRHFYYQEQTKRQATGERRLQTAEQRFDRATAATERFPVPTPDQLPATPEEPGQTAVPVGHRLETSAWHSIEVDNKTGKPVENPAFTYGHEYYRERAQESTPAQERNAAAGEVALVAAAMGQDGAPNGPATDGGTVTPPNIPSATTQGAPSGSLRAGVRSARQAAGSDATGPLWPWVVALVLVIICLIIVIH